MPRTKHFQDLLADIRIFAHRLIAVVVHLNDTYVLEERAQEHIPGFPRVIATILHLRTQVEHYVGKDRLMVVHSGDFLSPTRLGRLETDHGKTVVQLLNSAGLDYCVLGNHEFDYGEPALLERLGEMRCTVVLSNAKTKARNAIKSFALWPNSRNPLVAVTGVVSNDVFRGFSNTWSFDPPEQALQDFVKQTRRVPFHIVLTHATREEDRTMRTALADCPRVVVLGGHDHDIDWAEDDDYPLVMKNSSNLQTVRVLLLIAGGDSALQALNRNYRTLKGSDQGEPANSGINRRALLKELHPTDVRVFRAWINHRNPTVGRWKRHGTSVPEGYFTDDEPLASDALANRLTGMPFLPDVRHWVLKHRDHLRPERRDKNFVRTQLRQVQSPGERHVIRDFSRDTSERLEARDKVLRAQPTDFGIFVAECVRTHGKADVAILNSGSFRFDGTLPRRLSERDLREVFLYDRSDTIVVFDLPNAAIDALKMHGRARIDKGGYSQLSDKRSRSGTTSTIATVAYLFHNAKDKDGYIEVLARSMRLTSADVVQQFGIAPSKLRFSIIDAVLAQCAGVLYLKPSSTASVGDRATHFVELAHALSLLFHRKSGHRLGHARWNSSFAALITDDNPVADPELSRARDELRDFLKDVAKLPPPSGLVHLQELRKEVEAHRARFSNRIDYHKIFDLAASNIAGWRP